MALLVDTPRWPAHGTLYGHLVSDASLWELHGFAHQIGLDPRAFDHDHYDLAVARHPEAVAAGARHVDERELVTRLRTSGLRILPAQRAPRRRAAHHRVRAELLRTLGGHEPIVDDVLGRYLAEDRRYHDIRHLDEMMRTQHRLAAADGLSSPTRPELLAAAWHDAVYRGVPGQDERDSAALAADQLSRAGLPDQEIAEVERLVLLTIEHAADPADATGARLCDADMAILASAPGRYHVSVRDIRVEYGVLEDSQWTAGRRQVLEAFLATDRLYQTPAGRGWFDQVARRNMADELAHLTPPDRES